MKYKIGDKVRIKSLDWYNKNKDEYGQIYNCGPYTFKSQMSEYCGCVMTITKRYSRSYKMKEDKTEWHFTDAMIEGKIDEYIEETKRLGQQVGEKIGEVIVDYLDNKEQNKGEISDGYHTFNELYEYRLLYNASMFNELAKQGLYDVHKSKKHSDGEIPFGDSNWFIVMAELPTGQISNHYEMKDWDLFQIPEKEKANVWDGHTPKDVAERIRKFLTPKPKYPTTYEECCFELEYIPNTDNVVGYKYNILQSLQKLLICRDAYWKIAGEEMGLGESWEPDLIDEKKKYTIYNERYKVHHSFYQYHNNRILVFPTEEMRDAFYENFKELIEKCKELL